MPKETKREYDSANREEYNREVGQDENLLVKGRTQNAAGLGSVVKAVRPLRKPNETSSAYNDRVAKWQTEQDAKVAGQTKALKALKAE